MEANPCEAGTSTNGSDARSVAVEGRGSGRLSLVTL